MSRFDDWDDLIGSLDDWDDPMSTFALLVIIFGFTFVFAPFMVLVGTAPLVAAMLVFGLGMLGSFVWWTSNRSDTSDSDEETTHDRDPLAVLKERYARGELSEEEFEHRVTLILDVDEIARSTPDTERVAERE